MGVNGKQAETRNIIFQQKMRKTGGWETGKSGETTKNGETNRKKQKIARNTETRQDKILVRQDFDEISGNTDSRAK